MASSPVKSSERLTDLSNLQMSGMKGNDGKAAKNKAIQQFALILISAVMLVGSVKVFGTTAPWHSKAVPHEGQIVQDIRAAQNPGGDVKLGEEKLFEGFVESEGGKEAVSEWDGDIKESNFLQFEFANLDGEPSNTGIVVVELHPEWAPTGVERIKELTASSFWEGCRFFRVVPNFMVQIGINGDPSISKEWRSKHIKDDPVIQTNERGTVTFAMAGKGTRTSQIFFNTGTNNAFLDKQGFAPFGRVISGMDIVDKIYDGYREKPQQGSIQQRGNEYLIKEFPKLSFISRATFVNRS